MADFLVLNIRPASSSSIRAMDRHEMLRTPNGTSDIDMSRSHLNRTLLGLDTGPLASLEALRASGVKGPVAQAETPYLSIVMGASGSYFRPGNPDASGTWDDARLAAFEREGLATLIRQFGADLVHVSIHLDETTPHFHALVAPTYQKKERIPGKKTRGETDAAFQERREAARSSDGVRTIGRASHATLSMRGSFDVLRRSIAGDLSPLGIQYGNSREPDAPDPRTTRQWVADETVRLRDESRRLEREREAMQIREQVLDAAEDEVNRMRRQVETDRDHQGETIRQAANAAAQAVAGVFDGRISLGDRPGAIRISPDLHPIVKPIWSSIAPMIGRLANWWDRVRSKVEALPDLDRRDLMEDEDRPDIMR